MIGMIVFMRVLFVLVCLLLSGCSGHEYSEKEKLRACNVKEERIYRYHDETKYELAEPKLRGRNRYPWEERQVGGFPKITKEYFRCKGSSLHPLRSTHDSLGNIMQCVDCEGKEKHSLPLKEGKECIYPILIDLLNAVQEKAQKRVVITCGHRCPKHNQYADPSKRNQTSKHMIGAEVDFYVKGLEDDPEKVVQLIQKTYQEWSAEPPFAVFLTDSKQPGASFNKEVSVKIHDKEEDRDFDNRHPYPYITIEVRFDRNEGKLVHYNWAKAHKGFSYRTMR